MVTKQQLTANLWTVFGDDGNGVINSIALETANITTLNGNLVGNLTANVGDITINGGRDGQVLTTDGEGNLRWTTSSGLSAGNSITDTYSSVAAAPEYVAIDANNQMNVATFTSDGNHSVATFANDIYVSGNVITGGLSVGKNSLIDVGPTPVANGSSGMLYQISDQYSDYGFVANANVGATVLTMIQVDTIDIGSGIKDSTQFPGVFQMGTTVVAKSNVANTITISQPTLKAIRGNVTLGNIYNKVTTFSGWDQANSEFVMASNVGVANGIANIHTLANLRVDTIIGNVDIDNVTGIGNIASVDLDGNVSNVLNGNGEWMALPATDEISSANGNVTIQGTTDAALVGGAVLDYSFALQFGSVGSGNPVMASNTLTTSGWDYWLIDNQIYYDAMLAACGGTPGNFSMPAVWGDGTQGFVFVEFMSPTSYQFCPCVDGASQPAPGTYTFPLTVGGTQLPALPERVTITANDVANTLSNTWVFGSDGVFTLAGNAVDIKFANGTNAFGNVIAVNLSGDADQYLKGDGTWNSSLGLGTITSVDLNNESTQYLNGAGEWATISTDKISNGNSSVALTDTTIIATGELKITDTVVEMGSGGNIADDRGLSIKSITSQQTVVLTATASAGQRRIVTDTDLTGTPSGTIILVPSVPGALAEGTAIDATVGNEFDTNVDLLLELPEGTELLVVLAEQRYMGWVTADERFALAKTSTVTDNVLTVTEYADLQTAKITATDIVVGIDNTVMFKGTGGDNASGYISGEDSGESPYSGTFRIQSGWNQDLVVAADGQADGVFEWKFGKDGNLTLPGNTFAMNYANGDAITLTQTLIENGSSNVSIADADGNITISSGGIANIVAVHGETITTNYTTTEEALVGATDIIVDTVANLVVGQAIVSANITAQGTTVAVVDAPNLTITLSAAITNAAPTGTVFETYKQDRVMTVTGNLSVSGKTTLGNIEYVNIGGGNAGQILSTDGSGNLSFIDKPSSTQIVNGTSNVAVAEDAEVTISANGQANIFVISSDGSHAQTTITDDVSITGNLTVTGNMTYINTTNQFLTDPVMDLGVGANNSPITSQDGQDRGFALHSFGEGYTRTTVGSTAKDATTIVLNSVANLVVGMEVAHNSTFAHGTSISNVWVGNSTIEVTNAATASMNAGTTISIGLDKVRFIGWDTSDSQFVLASDAWVGPDNTATYNAYGKVRMGDVTVSSINIAASTPEANVYSMMVSDGNGTVSWSSLDRGTY